MVAFLDSHILWRGCVIAKPNKATQTKRNRERSKQEQQKLKQEKRALRSEQKKDRDRLTIDGVDPDIAGIVPGPQPIRSDYD